MYPTGAGTPEVRGYRDLNRIGRGGFSFVYRAEQVSLGRSVAIKLLLADLADEDEVRRFTNECVILGRLGAHRHVVDVYDAGVTDDGRPFIVMKFYGRGSLADRLRIGGPLPAKDVVSIGIKLAAALQAAHDIGVVHRDVKPDNVLIDDDGEPVLTDFGVAAVADAAGRYTSSVAFSHSHVAPEVLDRNEFGVASDIYSLGSTLYTLLTGRAAFAADTEARQIMAIMNDPPPPIDTPRVSTDVSAIVLKAMSKRPEDRYATADDLRFALEALVVPLRTVVDPKGPPDASAVTEAPKAPLDADVEVTRRRSAVKPSVEGAGVPPAVSAPNDPATPPPRAWAPPSQERTVQKSSESEPSSGAGDQSSPDPVGVAEVEAVTVPPPRAWAPPSQERTVQKSSESEPSSGAGDQSSPDPVAVAEVEDVTLLAPSLPAPSLAAPPTGAPPPPQVQGRKPSDAGASAGTARSLSRPTEQVRIVGQRPRRSKALAWTAMAVLVVIAIMAAALLTGSG